MNSDQNKNEILEVSQNSTDISNNYPFANNLNTEIEDINYSNLIEPSKDLTPSSGFGTIMLVGGIVYKLIKLSYGAIKLNEFLKGIDNNAGTQLLVHVEELIDKKLSTQYRNAATGAINSIARAHENYLTFFNQWKSTPTTQNGLQVESAFNSVNTLCIGALEQNTSLAVSGFEVLLLPNYAIAATMHLLLLRDAVLHRYQWLPNSNFTEDANYKILKEAMENYSTHCTRWYQDGLNRFRRSNFVDWVNFNNYRRDMTLSVLDIVALFPTYDPKLYPIATEVQLSRIIYTDLIIDMNNSFNPTFSRMESYLTIAPRRAAALNNIRIFTAYYPFPNNVSREYWSGNDNSLSNTPSINSGFKSDDRNVDPEVNFNMNNVDIFKINIKAHRSKSSTKRDHGVHWANFSGINLSTNFSKSYLYNRPLDSKHYNIDDRHAFLPGDSTEEPTRDNYTHRLLAVLVTHTKQDTNVNTSTFSYAWTHKSLNRENIFKSNSITQIPAIKTSSPSGDDSILGSLSTGGDIIILSDRTTGLFYDLKPENSLASNTNYIVRVRYASTVRNRLVLDSNRAPVASIDVEPTIQPGGYLNNLRYQDFRYATFPNTYNLAPHFRVGIFRDIAGTSLVIDKIELIPAHLMPSLEQENGNTTNL